MKNRVCAGIISYNPNIDRLHKNILSIEKQVECVLIFDNGSKNIDKIMELKVLCKNLVIFGNDLNLGISYGLNYLAQKSIELGYDWIYTIDQDSISNENTITKMLLYLDEINCDGVSQVCQNNVDKRRSNCNIQKICMEYEFVNYCITSGSMVNLDAYSSIGGFDDYLFIDQVDVDFCLRLTLNNYKILKINSLVLDHENGNIMPSKLKNEILLLSRFLRWEALKKLSYKREVSPFRLYYSTRNMIYIFRKYGKFIDKKKEIGRILHNSASSIIRGREKVDLIKSVLKGIYDGLSVDVNPYEVKSEDFEARRKESCRDVKELRL